MLTVAQLEKIAIPRLRSIGESLKAGRYAVHAHSVGARNALQGHAVYLDFTPELPVSGSVRLALMLLYLDSDSPAWMDWVAWSAEWLPWLPRELHRRPPDDLDKALSKLEEEYRKCLEAGPHLFPRETSEWQPIRKAPNPLDHETTSAALGQRFSKWDIGRLSLNPSVVAWGIPDRDHWSTLQRWCPALDTEALEDLTRTAEYSLSVERLHVPWPVDRREPPSDWLEFYRLNSTAHGIARVSGTGYSPDGKQALILLDHRIGSNEYVYGDWKGPEPARPDSKWPGEFRDLLVLQREPSGWRLAQRMEPMLPDPPQFIEARERERLQRELGDRARVESVGLNQERAEEAIVTAGGVRYEVLLGNRLHEKMWDNRAALFTEPVILVLEDELTGASILKALDHPL